MNWMCDVYCYADVHGGYTTHVAGNRIVRKPVPGDLCLTAATPEEWIEAHRKTMADLETIPREPIGLPMDGQSFNDPDLESFKARLLHLREMGYIVPDYVFETIDEEMREQGDG